MVADALNVAAPPTVTVVERGGLLKNGGVVITVKFVLLTTPKFLPVRIIGPLVRAAFGTTALMKLDEPTLNEAAGTPLKNTPETFDRLLPKMATEEPAPMNVGEKKLIVGVVDATAKSVGLLACTPEAVIKIGPGESVAVGAVAII